MEARISRGLRHEPARRSRGARCGRLGWLAPGLLWVVACWCAGAGAADPADRLTVAEREDFEATSSYGETLSFLRRLEREMPELRLESFGMSAQGRSLPLVIVSKDRAFTPRAAAATGKAILLVQNGIHGGEIDGKDACLMILRDLAEGRDRALLDGVILLVVPIYNVDGHERVSPFNRPNQNGPTRGMGFRTTADGHDLNRDHLKVDTPEARAMVRLFNRWRPHLHVDNHVTDGVDHDWVLTYTWVEAPQLAPSLDAWMSAHMPPVIETTRSRGHPLGPYVDPVDRGDPRRGFSSYVGEPRYATGYYPLRNRPSILVENHAYKPYRDRVLANRDFLLALFRETARDPAALIGAVRLAERRTVELGGPSADPSDLVLDWEVAERGDPVRWPVYDWYTEPSVALGVPLLRFRRGEVREIEVDWRHRPRPVRQVARPRGYFVLPGWPAIEDRLRLHALEVRRVERPIELSVETIRISDPRRDADSGPSYQGRTRLSVNVRRRVERRRVPEGALWIPAAQPDFEVAAQLLEPEAPDSLVRWGLLSIVLERKEYIDPRVLEPLVERMLDDERVRTEWRQALEDDSLASDPSARWLWWYRRTEYWDDSVGRMPVLRLMEPAEIAVGPWEPPLGAGRGP